MANDFFNLATNLLDGVLSAKVTMGKVESIGPLPSVPQHRPETRSGTDERLDQLLLMCTAMWQLIKEKTDLTEDDLVNRIALLDAQDGTADGKLTEKPRPCPKCKRIVCSKHERCLYCGTPVPIENVFKTV